MDGREAKDVSRVDMWAKLFEECFGKPGTWEQCVYCTEKANCLCEAKAPGFVQSVRKVEGPMRTTLKYAVTVCESFNVNPGTAGALLQLEMASKGWGVLVHDNHGNLRKAV